MQIPPVEIFIVGYESGMAYYNAQKGTNVVSKGTYVGDFEAPDEGKSAGNSLLDEGVDIIFGVGGKTGNGGLVAVRERAEAGDAVAGIGVDVDQYFTLPTEKGILITSVEKRLDNAVFNAIDAAVADNFGGGGVYVGTLENDGVGLAPYHDWEDKIPAELQAEVDALKPQIIAGTLSTGQNYLVCTNTADSGGRRSPLTIAVSRPGEEFFSRIYRIRDAVHDGPGESGPECRLSYPYAVERNGQLYVVYSNCGGRGGNRNSAELAIIPVEALRGK
jgi:basic membrane lipoprotein Med (substrate-binding protein (PBP1-ABC) superfamily)